ncbi:MAG: hemerythrin, partial [Acidobacteria bacterium]|nr:hemerythrin [Acidobacteriota bacterium]
MSLITWSDELSVGVSAFDNQHKRLVALINELHDAMSAGKGSKVLGKILSELADYTVY